MSYAVLSVVSQPEVRGSFFFRRSPNSGYCPYWVPIFLEKLREKLSRKDIFKFYFMVKWFV